jgi:hypothetical protein
MPQLIQLVAAEPIADLEKAEFAETDSEYFELVSKLQHMSPHDIYTLFMSP